MNQIVLLSLFVFFVCVIIVIFGKKIELFCSGRAAHFMQPPNQGLCLHPYLFCGIKAGGHPGDNWILTP